MNYTKYLVTTDIKAPKFIGSMVRGALGVALKEVVCINPAFECGSCFAKDNCIYYDFFEKRDGFVNYRLDFLPNQPYVNFNIYLFNSAIDKSPYILSAIEKLISKKGLGKDRVTSNNFKIYNNSSLIYENGTFKNFSPEVNSFSENGFCPIVKLKFITQFRAKKQGKLITAKNLEAKDIFLSILKKQEYLSGKKEQIETMPTIVSKNLFMVDIGRYSNRQKTKMQIGGIVGEIILNNLTPQTYRLLKYGQISGIGKLNTFGLGKIEVEDLIWKREI